jgi:hypothetical protein
MIREPRHVAGEGGQIILKKAMYFLAAMLVLTNVACTQEKNGPQTQSGTAGTLTVDGKTENSKRQEDETGVRLRPQKEVGQCPFGRAFSEGHSFAHLTGDETLRC